MTCLSHMGLSPQRWLCGSTSAADDLGVGVLETPIPHGPKYRSHVNAKTIDHGNPSARW